MLMTGTYKAASLLPRCERGNMAMFTALMIIPFLLMAGMAIDLSRTYTFKQRLSTALDTAALAAGSYDEEATDAELKVYARKVFDANMSGAEGTVTAFELTFNRATNIITATARGDVDTSLMKIGGFDDVEVSESAEVTRETRGLEVALVLDNTGSMWSSNNIGALRTATQDMIDILFDDVETHPLLRMAIIPYVTTVNVGLTFPNGAKFHEALVSPMTYVWNSSEDTQYWKGCIEEREEPYDTSVDAPSVVPSGKGYWKQYWWASSKDNKWSSSDIDTNFGRSDNGVHGPNIGCPTPITPLTNSKSTVTAAATALTAWNRGGTFGNVGFAWGWRMIDPDFTPIPEAYRGYAYDHPDWQKAIIMMTDGNNQTYELTNDDSPNKSDGNTTHSDYTAYGRIDDDRMGTTSNSDSTALAYMNGKLQTMCAAAKAKGILVYSIVFSSSPSSTTKSLYKSCATDISKYFLAPSQEDLKDAFQAIGTELSNLRLSK